jgi:hypothetical protein
VAFVTAVGKRIGFGRSEDSDRFTDTDRFCGGVLSSGRCSQSMDVRSINSCDVPVKFVEAVVQSKSRRFTWTLAYIFEIGYRLCYLAVEVLGRYSERGGGDGWTFRYTDTTR